MNAHEVPEPILNSPFEEPEAYWRISEHGPPEQRSGRLDAKRWTMERTREGSLSSSWSTEFAISLPSGGHRLCAAKAA